MLILNGGTGILCYLFPFLSSVKVVLLVTHLVVEHVHFTPIDVFFRSNSAHYHHTALA